MANGSIITNSGKNTMLYRSFTPSADLSSTQYLPPTQFKVGISNNTPQVTDTDLAIPILIGAGTVIDNGSSSLTGSNAGQNTSSNTSIYKEGSNLTDNTSQNLLATTGNATKTWTKGSLTISATKPISFWLYISSTSIFSKFLSSGTAFMFRIRTTGDAANKYYYKSYSVSNLSVGWISILS